MESSEQTSPSTTNEMVHSSAEYTNLQWYQYWSSQLGYSDQLHPQMNASGHGRWDYCFDHSQSGSYSDFESTSRPMETWNSFTSGEANHHCLGNSIGHHLPQISPDSVLQTPVDPGYHHHEPFFNSWSQEAAPIPHTVPQSRRPSYHSDPGHSTYPQYNATHRSFTDLRSNTESGVIDTPITDVHGMEQISAPSTDLSLFTEPLSPTSTSPIVGHVSRPVIRCYEHGCDGRTFSSISNYRRHQRERAGQSAVCFCPRCGAAFYRRWTRDHHVERGSCMRQARWN
jgi:hypothetical protein